MSSITGAQETSSADLEYFILFSENSAGLTWAPKYEWILSIGQFAWSSGLLVSVRAHYFSNVPNLG